jgi:parvulin-like peptidyl-prolyl isomerase
MGHFNYGVHLESAGDLERAIAEVEQAVRLDPEYLEAQVVLAQMYEQAGRTEDALRTIETLGSLDPEAAAQLEQWRRRLLGQEQQTSAALAAGKVHLLHIITEDEDARRLVVEGLAAGEDFGNLATRFSTGATAVRGGDIGWVDPAQMMDELRIAIERLEPGETSPPVEAGGQTHFFKRIR